MSAGVMIENGREEKGAVVGLIIFILIVIFIIARPEDDEDEDEDEDDEEHETRPRIPTGNFARPR